MIIKRPRKIRMLPIVLPWALAVPAALAFYLLILRSCIPGLPVPWEVFPLDILGYPIFPLGEWLSEHVVKFPKHAVLPLLMLILMWWAIVGAAFGFVHYAIRRFIWPKYDRLDICTTCGYSLQGLPEPRCPECGKEFDPAIQTSDEETRPQ